jgi:hypothetical protein
MRRGCATFIPKFHRLLKITFVIGAEACTSSSPFTVTDAFRASPSKLGVVARLAVKVTVFAAS